MSASPQWMPLFCCCHFSINGGWGDLPAPTPTGKG
nr:MAG TPA: hypothetical protein [Caudoviricetes sp.]